MGEPEPAISTLPVDNDLDDKVNRLVSETYNQHSVKRISQAEPVSAEPVAWMHPNALENFKSGEFNRALIACEKVDDYTMPLYASQPARGCEPITKYVELTREQAFEHLKTNSFHLERTGLYKLVINPDWKPQPPQE
jgi:hypothetical protein